MRRDNFIGCMLAVLFALAVVLPSSPAFAAGKKENRAHELLSKIRVLAFDLPTDQSGEKGGRVVFIQLDRPAQITVANGGKFEPEKGMVFTVDRINPDGSVYVSGSGITMGRIRVATPAEREAWLKQKRAAPGGP